MIVSDHIIPDIDLPFRKSIQTKSKVDVFIVYLICLLILSLITSYRELLEFFFFNTAHVTGTVLCVFHGNSFSLHNNLVR